MRIHGVRTISELAATSAMTLLVAIALLQILEPRIPALGTQRGNLASICIKIVLGFVLIQSTGGLNSGYYLILLLPVVSAAGSTQYTCSMKPFAGPV